MSPFLKKIGTLAILSFVMLVSAYPADAAPDASVTFSPKPSLRPTHAEIFSVQHPAYYLDYLSFLQDLMVADGSITPADRMTFSREEDVLRFWRTKGYGYLVDQGILSKRDRAAWNRGIALVRKLHKSEASLLLQAKKLPGAASFFTPPQEQLADLRLAEGGLFAWATSLLGDALGNRTAYAQTDCFKGGASSPKPGTNLTAPCCNCHNVDGEPIGCLNRICPFGAAIFDQSTFICGCAI
jgi:hypothetical protein